MNKEALKETFKSFLRFVYFGVLGLVGTGLTSLIASESLQNTVVNIGDVYLPVGVVIVAVLGGIAKMVDRYIHTNENINLNGITPTDLLER